MAANQLLQNNVAFAPLAFIAFHSYKHPAL